YSSRSVKFAAPVMAEETTTDELVSSDKSELKSKQVSVYGKASNDVYHMVEKTPEFPGGQEALNTFLKQNLQYPKTAKEMGISGRVIVQFMVNENGDISDIKVIRGIGGGCDEEAVRVIKKMGKWVPAKQNGKAVKSLFTLPITFSLKG
ncbi:MAG TPA: energy transducer TonB, partial [Bacteroidales bacterium]